MARKRYHHFATEIHSFLGGDEGGGRASLGEERQQHPEQKEEEAWLEEQFSERVGIEQAEMEMIAHSYIAEDEPEEGYTVSLGKTSEKTTRRRRKPAKSKGLSSLFKRGGGSSDKPRAKRRKVTQRATKQR